MLSPLGFLAFVSTGTILVLVIHEVLVRAHQRKLVKLARNWRMHYAPDDRFNLAPRVAERLAMTGAADVRVVDLIYGMEQGVRRYVFAAHYTRGVVRWKQRAKCVASLDENSSQAEWSRLEVAPPELPLMQQYEALAKPNSGSSV